ncbi:nuclear transport factor 2 family protein [Nocardia alni]|uniref:nuclear transport factor 2 family protein n=1 Tax=Nocardia alni TaxID=2815723 RepID=UPI001C218150|nr:nuclear transport factor 2 family protein [Nocardia alni]
MATPQLPAPIAGFLDAINNRDAEGAGKYFTDDISYHLLMPHPAIVGREAVVDALRGAITEAERVQWDVVTFAATADTALVERLDRFWFRGTEVAIECTGVFELADGKIAAIRDYADMNTWRERKQAALGDR